MDTPGIDRAEADLARARRAAAFLEADGVFREAWTELDRRLTEAWRSSPANDQIGREHIWQMLAAMRALENVLQGYVDSGAVIQSYLNDAARARAAYSTSFPA